MVTGRVVSRGFLGTTGKAKCRGGVVVRCCYPGGIAWIQHCERSGCPRILKATHILLFPMAAALPPFIPSLRDAATKLDSLQARGTTWWHISKHFCTTCCLFPPSPPRKADWRWALPGIPTGLRRAGCPSCITALGRREIFIGKSEWESEWFTLWLGD